VYHLRTTCKILKLRELAKKYESVAEYANVCPTSVYPGVMGFELLKPLLCLLFAQ
jgi:hypothetical protein